MQMIDGNRERKDRVRVPRDEPPGTRLVGMVGFLLYWEIRGNGFGDRSDLGMLGMRERKKDKV